MARIIITGPGASGKDHLKKRLLNRGLCQSVSYTTRPPRNGETHGIDYYFVSVEEFQKMIENQEFREWNLFGDKNWYYGTSSKEFDKGEVFVMTPSGIKALTKEERTKSFIVFIDISEEVRRSRLNERKDADDPERRINTDKKDFADFADFDLRITDPNF